VFSFHNNFHYGDNILNLKFFFNISEVLKKRGIKIQYYYDDVYNNKKEELERFVNSDTVTLFPLSAKSGDSVELWMGTDINGKSYRVFNTYYFRYYTNIVKLLGLTDENIDTSLYQQEPYLQDIYNGLDPKYKDLDILIINAMPQSGQFNYDKGKMDEMCSHLSKKYKVAITTCIDDTSIPCTMNDKLMLKDIGAISTHAKYIIAIHSGPLTSCFNKDTKHNVKKWVLFTNDDISHEDLNCVILKNDYDLTKIEEHLK